MIPNNSSQQSAVQEAGERPEVTEETHLLQTSLSELDITISRRDTTEPYIIAAMRELKWIATSSPWAVITRVLQASFYFVNVIAF
ncbi:hypothetical protein EV177_002704 [Coemansia sp. RSA 1804]|nr:hypothetical protein EV177_002704 [Coemansia sp. RSA 1804]